MSFVKHIFNKESPDQITVVDVQKLIDNKTEEFLYLDYEEIPKKVQFEGISKHVSGFLNTAGGVVVFGVSERTEGNRNVPHKITWTEITKETLEQNLFNRINPWNDDIQIVPIQNPNNEKQRIFIVLVPKSTNPPHMSNYTYYQRLNFRTEPMNHQTVLRAFQTNWLNKRELHENVIQPLYSEISANFEKLERYERGDDNAYIRVVNTERFLYDLIDSSIREKIEKFYNKLRELNSKSAFMAHKIATIIINKELSKVYEELEEWICKHLETDILVASVTVMDISGSTTVHKEITLNGALIQRKSILSYLQSKYPDKNVIKIEPVLKFQKGEISQSTFEDIWKRCEVEARKNKTYLSIWRETPKLLKLGKELLSLMLREQ